MSGNLWPFRLALCAVGSLSIASLLLYFLGVASFVLLSSILLSIEVVGLAALGWLAWSHQVEGAKRLLVSGLWAGCLATLAYDVVRVPIVHSGVPVFKAISYFGTVLLGVEHPTVASEVVGWAYHLSNGLSFALMYAALAMRPGPVTAVLWGMSLEAAMLVTPYAEVFGYQRDAKFLAITVGSHAVYGLVLWLGLRTGGSRVKSLAWRQLGIGFFAVVVGLTAMGADFSRNYAAKIPASPPPYIGPHLYTVWNVPEPDRVAVMWVMKRFVDTEAVFYFIEPFDRVRFGSPFDIPEASVRRSSTQSATQRLVAERRLENDRLKALARMTELTEVSPWRLASDSDASRLAERLRLTAQSRCGRALTGVCLPGLMQDLDDWFAGDR